MEHQLQKLIKTAVDKPPRGLVGGGPRKEARTGADVEKEGARTGAADKAEENEPGEEE